MVIEDMARSKVAGRTMSSQQIGGNNITMSQKEKNPPKIDNEGWSRVPTRGQIHKILLFSHGDVASLEQYTTSRQLMAGIIPARQLA